MPDTNWQDAGPASHELGETLIKSCRAGGATPPLVLVVAQGAIEGIIAELLRTHARHDVYELLQRCADAVAALDIPSKN